MATTTGRVTIQADSQAEFAALVAGAITSPVISIVSTDEEAFVLVVDLNGA